jgi:hypothetical protein
VAVIYVRGQAYEVADHQALTFAGLGAEAYLRMGELWNADQQQRYTSAGQQQQQAQPAPQQQPAPVRRIDQEAEARVERRSAIAEIAKSRNQTSW